MAGLLGEGGITALSGTCSSTSPATLADFRPETGDGISRGVDGRPCNIFTVTNNDTSGKYLLKVQVAGLHDFNATSNHYGAVCLPQVPKPLQLVEHSNQLALVKAWLTDLAGVNLAGTDTASSVYVLGEVSSRRG